MTDRTLTLTITIPEDMDDDLGGLGIMLESSGVSSDVAAPLIIAAAEATMRSEIRDDLERGNPMATADVLDAMAFLNARLKAVDTLMHLPEAPPAIGMRIEL